MSNALQTLKILHILYVPLERTQSYMCALTAWPLTYSDLRLQLCTLFDTRCIIVSSNCLMLCSNHDYVTSYIARTQHQIICECG